MDLFTTAQLLRALFRLGTSRSSISHLHHFHVCPKDEDWPSADASGPKGGDSGLREAAEAVVGGSESGADGPLSPTRPVRHLDVPESSGEFRCCTCLMGLTLSASDEGTDPGHCAHLWQHIMQEPDSLMVMCGSCGRILSGAVNMNTTVMKPDPDTGYAPMKLLMMCCGDDTRLQLRSLKFLVTEVIDDLLANGSGAKSMSFDPAEKVFHELVMGTSAVSLLYGIGYKDTTDSEGNSRIALEEYNDEVAAKVRQAKSDLGLLSYKIANVVEQRVALGQADAYDAAVTEDERNWMPAFKAGDYALASVVKGQDIEALQVAEGEGVSGGSPASSFDAEARARLTAAMMGGSRGGSMGVGGIPSSAPATDSSTRPSFGRTESEIRRGYQPVAAPKAKETDPDVTISPIGKEEEDDAPHHGGGGSSYETGGGGYSGESGGTSGGSAGTIGEMLGGQAGSQMYVVQANGRQYMVMMSPEQAAALMGGGSQATSALARGIAEASADEAFDADDVAGDDGDETKGGEAGEADAGEVAAGDEEDLALLMEAVAEAEMAGELGKDDSAEEKADVAVDGTSGPVAPADTAAPTAPVAADPPAPGPSTQNPPAETGKRARLPSLEDVSRVASSIIETAPPDADTGVVATPPVLDRQRSGEALKNALETAKPTTDAPTTEHETDS